MKMKLLKTVPLAFFALLIISWSLNDEYWRSKKFRKYTLHFTKVDSQYLEDYAKFISQGIKEVELFFGACYKNKFSVYIHPTRSSLDSAWQNDWNMPNFKSECWMVASGIAQKLDIISPKIWDRVACEHKYEDKIKTQQLISHELFHVFHGQLNASPDFSNTDSIDWFVEGFATYASGQCDSARINEVKKAIELKKTPPSLDKFWTGKLKYGISGSVILFIDKNYGRKKLRELLQYNKKNDILKSLNITEIELLNKWSAYITRV